MNIEMREPLVFGNWLLVARASERSMSEVFVALELGDRSGRLRILKRPPLGEIAAGPVAEALRREAAVLRAAKGGGLVALEDSGEVAGLPYVVLERIRGVTLDALVARAPLSEAAARTIALDLARALARLHEHGFVHGDVAPSNILVDEEGGLTIVDFGLALRAGEARELPAGTPGYASPEMAAAKPAHPSDDVYAWAVIVAELLLGRRLFDEHDLAGALARKAEIPNRLRGNDLVVRALELDATARPSLGEIVRWCEARRAEDGRAELASRASGAAEASDAPRATVPGRPISATLSDPRTPPREPTRPPAAAEVLAKLARAEAAPAPARARMERSTLVTLAVALLFAFAVGLFVGRRFARPKGEATLTLPMLPARAEIQLDGRTMIVSEPGRAVPIETGRHTITLTTGKRGPHDYEFTVQPGEHIVVVQVAPGARKAND
ncbi:MAG: serine/threonine-protein kinase [Polyangiaceae bacterium]